MRKYIVPAAKPLSADLLEFAVPEIVEVISGRNNSKAASKSMGRMTVGKQLCSDSRKGLQAASFYQNLPDQSRRAIFVTNILWQYLGLLDGKSQ